MNKYKILEQDENTEEEKANFFGFVCFIIGVLVAAILFLVAFPNSASAQSCTQSFYGYHNPPTTLLGSQSYTTSSQNPISIPFQVYATTTICAVDLYAYRVGVTGTENFVVEIATTPYPDSLKVVYASSTFNTGIFPYGQSNLSSYTSIPTPIYELYPNNTYFLNIAAFTTGNSIRAYSSLVGTPRTLLFSTFYYTGLTPQNSTSLNTLFYTYSNASSSALNSTSVILNSMPSDTTCVTNGATTTCSSIQTDVVATNDFGVTIGMAYLLAFLILISVVYVFNFRKR